ncbi:hypothetical protein Deba_1387 [Desulfarculus baarsii DSM 2075]|uniref:Uncharacterized protein n=1 Tax=Desulfarculus baarsii (strain ATCC 33931 / DSM 2075 / LMG 7858 / VKM B-1802 / 2st14) TaxID=644282 RepID=E1QGR2_DESB2|nr:hypothetical protein Deba_1387 [Desulfarculus baarsii DSM 2075]
MAMLAVVVAAVAALIMAGPAPARAQLDDPLVIHDGVDCFNWPGAPQRLCAQWRLIAAAKGGVKWTMFVSGVGMQEHLFAQEQSFSAAEKAGLIAALRKGLRWSRTAAREKIDVVRRIGVVGGRLTVDFLSTGGGRECVVRLQMQDWLKDKPVPMFVAYGRQQDARHGLGALIKALEGSEAAHADRQKERARRMRLLK